MKLILSEKQTKSKQSEPPFQPQSLEEAAQAMELGAQLIRELRIAGERYSNPTTSGETKAPII